MPTPDQGKYEPLYQWLCAQHALGEPRLTVSFTDIERVLEDTLPPSARKHRAWWSNGITPRPRPETTAWLEAGWEVEEVNQASERVTFRRR